MVGDDLEQGGFGLGFGQNVGVGSVQWWVLSHLSSADHAACGLRPHYPVQQPI